MDLPLFLLALLFLLAIAGVILGVRAWTVHRLALERVRAAAVDAPETRRGDGARDDGWLRRWLLLAGYRNDAAVAWFLAASAASLVVGIGSAVLMRLLLVQVMVAQVINLPGGVGDALAAVLQAGPWIVGAMFALTPTMVVRARRRRLVREIERDLPLVLELFATLAQAGLGFDAALARIVEGSVRTRPLIAEFIAFQRDLLGGVPRVQALRHFARRLDVPTMTGFISATIQAEQIGASVSDTLRHQADDLRDRRREQALLLAQALPVKLVVPLVVCFLPGIFLSTLAPVLYQMLEITNSLFRAPGR